MQQQFLENRDRLAYLQTEYDRYRTLKDADATASKNFTKAEADLRAARTTGQVLAAKLRQYQIDPDQLTPENLKTAIAITAPVSGTVSRILSNVGTAMTTGTAVCEITDYSQLHPVLFIFEKDIAKVRNGQQVQLQFPGETGTPYSASIYNIERTVDADRKTVKVHARLTVAPPAHFTMGAYMDARVVLSGAGGVAALPTASIVREGDTDYIFIQETATAEGADFRKIPVRTGSSDQTYTAVTPFSPLPAGAKIVVKGAYYVSAQGAGVTAE
jgi:membrane fusion protein, heavy metal efflux system